MYLTTEAPKYMKQKLTEMKKEIHTLTITDGEFNIYI